MACRVSQDLENQYELKLAIEMERYDALSDVLERERQSFKASLASASSRRESEVASLSLEIQSKQRTIDELRASKEVPCPPLASHRAIFMQ